MIAGSVTIIVIAQTARMRTQKCVQVAKEKEVKTGEQTGEKKKEKGEKKKEKEKGEKKEEKKEKEKGEKKKEKGEKKEKKKGEKNSGVRAWTATQYHGVRCVMAIVIAVTIVMTNPNITAEKEGKKRKDIGVRASITQYRTVISVTASVTVSIIVRTNTNTTAVMAEKTAEKTAEKRERDSTARTETTYLKAGSVTTTATVLAVKTKPPALTVWESPRSTWVESPCLSTLNTTEESSVS